MGESMDIFKLNNLYKLTKASSRVAFAGSSVLFTGAVASQDGSNFEVEEVIVTAQKKRTKSSGCSNKYYCNNRRIII